VAGDVMTSSIRPMIDSSRPDREPTVAGQVEPDTARDSADEVASSSYSVGRHPGGNGSLMAMAPFWPRGRRPRSRRGHGRRTRARLRRGARLDREFSMPSGFRGGWASQSSVSPMIDHRDAQLLLGPLERLRIVRLAGEKERRRTSSAVLLDEFSFGVLAPYGRNAVAPVKSVCTPCCETTRQKGPGSGFPPAALVQDGRIPFSRGIDDCTNARPPSRCRLRPVRLARPAL